MLQKLLKERGYEVGKVDGILGYSKDAKVTVTQDLPLKMTLLGLEYKVAVNQGT